MEVADKLAGMYARKHSIGCALGVGYTPGTGRCDMMKWLLRARAALRPYRDLAQP